MYLISHSHVAVTYMLTYHSFMYVINRIWA